MNFSWLFERPIAHRGLHTAEYPENSIPAYKLAIEKNYNIEIDVHLTSDGYIVVFHDDTLKRVCGVDKKVKDCTLKELKSMKLLGTEYTIPTLDEFLELVHGKVGILCEIKGVNPLDNSIPKALCKRLETYRGNIALQSFNFGSVAYCRKHSNLPCGQLCSWRIGENFRAFALTPMGKLWILKLSRPHFTAYDVRAMLPQFPENKYVKKMSKKMPFLMWTINDEQKLDIALKEAHGIIFEKMDLEIIEKKFPNKRKLD